MCFRGFNLVNTAQPAITFIAANYIAYCVYCYAVKAAVAHVLCNMCGAGAVCVGKVGHSKLANVFKPRVAVLGQCFMPVPQHIAHIRRAGKLVAQANFCNAVDLAQAFLQFKIWVTVQAPLKRSDDLLAL